MGDTDTHALIHINKPAVPEIEQDLLKKEGGSASHSPSAGEALIACFTDFESF